MATTKQDFLFAGLTNLNTGFDAAGIQHFSPKEFQSVIDRCAEQRIEIYGVEVSSIVDGAVSLEEVEINPGEADGYAWARKIARAYLGKPGITVCATYSEPDGGHKTANGETFAQELEDFEAEQDRDLT